MLLGWRIRYIDSRDRRVKDRDLWLDTDALPAREKAAVEFIYAVGSEEWKQRMPCYRHLFHDGGISEEDLNTLAVKCGVGGSFCLRDYLEDENGKRLTWKEAAVILTGSANAVMFPPGTPEHMIQLAFAEKPPIPIDKVSVSKESLEVMKRFAHDLREMLASTFYTEGPGTLQGDYRVETAATHEEIRSFLMIFRRLYMRKEPANYSKATKAFAQVIDGHPLAIWLTAETQQYEDLLKGEPQFLFFRADSKRAFCRKRLIDVFLYTQYAHQPDETRQKQFSACLAAVDGKRPLLTWLFFSVVWECALHMRNAGVLIVDLYDRYCKFHKVSGHVLPSVLEDNPGLGTLEKKEARQARLLREKADDLAIELWKEAGSPAEGHTQFLDEACEQIKAQMRME